MKIPRLNASGLLWIRFPAMLGLLAVMLVVGQDGVKKVADGINLRLFNSARFEEATRSEMEFNDLLNKAYRFTQGDGTVSREDVRFALDIFWSRMDTLRTASYRDALASGEVRETAIVSRVFASLPRLDAAVLALEAGNPASYKQVGDFAMEFQAPLLEYSDRSYTARRNQLRELVEKERQSLDDLRSIQIEFVGLSCLVLIYVLVELSLSRRINRRLKVALEDKRRLLASDHLTGIANRRHFEEALAEQSMQGSFAVVLVDLDGFKGVNDTLGHAAGDHVLKAVAEILDSLRLEGDIVSRLGGDEFAILLDGSRERARHYAEAAVARVSTGCFFDGKPVRISASLGIAHIDDARMGATPEQMMRDADAALYVAKAAGRNCIRFTTPDIMAMSHRKQALQVEIRSAIETGQIDVAFQPIVSLADGRVTSLEALVRWEHPDLGLIDPHELVVAAEQASEILPLTLFVIERACNIRSTLGACGRDLQVAVNVSPRLLTLERFSDAVIDVVHRHAVQRGGLLLELTEDAMMDESETVLRNIEHLRDGGIDFAVDDFGRGYSNLGRLAGLEFRRVKLDKSLIDNVTSSARTVDIVRGIGRMAADLGMDVVAEGVETAEQFAALQSLGIPFAQGYHFARPMKPLLLLPFLLGKPLPVEKRTLRAVR
ncbi:EAL domain-containing protein [Shinella kummerowiae]|uniref:EAL domain-containing protein n=1 Tax=Shinella kummerowiae TaxID=417745 RepID=A0A6N8S3S7_9HYPH|nr:bifunctional diguanylate cyclase/phosphodiesterase [Shinella kummerowiae]MXN43745.1 EAL domain-containing protein [Shinella kummerowiae]